MQVHSVNPIYYVTFTTGTILASVVLFQGFNTTNTSNTVSLLCGFVVIFLGVQILMLSRTDEPPLDPNHTSLESGVMNPRLSLQGRMSLDGWNEVVGTPTSARHHIRNSSSGGGGVGIPSTPTSGRHGRNNSLYRAQSATLFNAFEDDEPQRLNAHPPQELHDLREEDDEDDDVNERTQILRGSSNNSPRTHSPR